MGEQITYGLPEAIEATTNQKFLSYFDEVAFKKVLQETISGDKISRSQLFAQMARFNALYMVARAGSGHLGSSFSSLDIVSWLYLNVLKEGDRYFSSKGHDSPGLYAVQTALGIVPFEKIHALRRLGGLPGHPDVGTPGAFTNTGSLGMGVSKAKGFLKGDSLSGNHQSRVFVLTGDGELQEGQFWESLSSAPRTYPERLTVIVDHNKIQSDTFVKLVNDLGNLEEKFRAFGWDTYRCDGHDFEALSALLGNPGSEGKPKVIIADTIKGRGVTFMEHTSMTASQEYYRFHSGAPSQDDYEKAAAEILHSVASIAAKLNVVPPQSRTTEFEPLSVPATFERMIPTYSQTIVKAAERNPKIVAMDADLILDTGLIPFKEAFPERFIECGIAEQDMVSQAGAMALAGVLPIVHSFACFLTTRPAEQIYNNCTERSKIVYTGSLAGLLPGGPGHSHQAVRDITAMASMPGITILEPATASQLTEAFDWAVNVNPESTYLRLTSIPYELRPELGTMSLPPVGQGKVICDGDAATVIVSGPILSVQVLKAADLLRQKGLRIRIIVTPWLNRFDAVWYREIFGSLKNPVVLVENHYVEQGFGVWFVAKLAQENLVNSRIIRCVGISEIPVCGRNDEVLRHHRLDADSIAANILSLVQNK